MNVTDFKLLLNSIDDEDFNLYINTDNGMVKVDSFRLNFKEGYLVLNTNNTTVTT